MVSKCASPISMLDEVGPAVVDLTDDANTPRPLTGSEDLFYLPRGDNRRRSRGASRRHVAAVACRGGTVTFIGGDEVASGGALLVIIEPRTSQRYLAVVASLANALGLSVEVLAWNGAHRRGGSEPLDVAAARRVARQLTASTTASVSWDVLYGPIRRGIEARVRVDAVSAITLPHDAHDQRSCRTVRLAVGLPVPVLLA